ncbi:hypothetical protein D5086_029820 [Populus alba]|uniref:Uncharacterized protein n=1 Tax=Populus alba TaxID=43335 RepID=A0ACC4AUR0_POPAL
MRSMDKCFCASVLVLLCLLSSIQVIFAANYVPTEKTLLDCGANSDERDLDGRVWTSDKGSSFLSSSGKSSIATATPDPAVPQIPYLTARIFQSSFTYSFPVVSGHKSVRLYFYPSSYNGLNASDARFSVTAGSYTLLSNFSVAQTTDALNFASIMNEYLINVNGLFRSWSDDQIYLYGSAFGVPQSADPNVTIRYPPGMPSYVAPDNVYLTARSMGPAPNVNVNYNLTWIFSVDSGFNYLVRLHFCEVSNITKINQRVFDIFLNNQTAEEGADVIAWAGGNGNNGVPVIKDYVLLVPTGPPQQDIWLALHPDLKLKPQYYDSILNGVEIFKLSSPNGNLAGPNPIPAPEQDIIDPSRARPASGSGHSKSQTAIIAGGVSGGVVLAVVIGFCVLAASRRHRQGKEASSSDGPSGWLPLSLYGNSHSAGSAKTNTTGSYASSLPSNLCRHFSFAEIKSATSNFDEALLLGVGGFEFALQLQESAEDGGKGIVGADDEEVPFNVAYKGKAPDASPGYDGIVTDSRSSGISMSIGGRSLASEDSDGLTPSAVFSQIMNPKGR